MIKDTQPADAQIVTRVRNDERSMSTLVVSSVEVRGHTIVNHENVPDPRDVDAAIARTITRCQKELKKWEEAQAQKHQQTPSQFASPQDGPFEGVYYDGPDKYSPDIRSTRGGSNGREPGRSLD